MALDYIHTNVLDHIHVLCIKHNVLPFFHLSQRLHQLQHPFGAHFQSSFPFSMVFGY